MKNKYKFNGDDNQTLSVTVNSYQWLHFVNANEEDKIWGKETTDEMNANAVGICQELSKQTVDK